MALSQQQHTFHQAVSFKRAESAALDLIAKGGVASSQRRLEVYQNNTQAILTRALSATFPVCERLVGQRFFEAMAGRYIQVYPSKTTLINCYGEALPKFIDNFAPAKSLPYLSDVARLELAWQRVFYGPLATRLQGEQPDPVLQLVENAVLLASDYPVLRIWEVNQPNYQGDEIVSLDEGGVRLVVWRPENTVLFERLSKSQWLLLSWMSESLSLDELGQRAQTQDIDIMAELPEIIRKGWLADNNS